MKLNTFAKAGFGLAVATAIVMPVRAAEEFPHITQTELTEAIKEKKVTLLDVNGSESYKAGRIPGALDYAVVKDDLKAKLPADKGALVVAYCGNEQCGAYKKAAKAATDLGYTNVKHFSPGIAGWKKSGAPVDKG